MNTIKNNLEQELKAKFSGSGNADKILNEPVELKKEQYDNITLSEPEKRSALYQALKKRFNYFDVNMHSLSEEELGEVYRQARMQKQGEINTSEYVKRICAEPEPKQLLTAEQTFEKLLDWLKVNTAEVNLGDNRKEIYFQLCLYFTNDSRFEGDLNKSLMLQGGIGTGKTTVMTFFQRNQKQNFKVIRTRAVAYHYKDKGVEAIETFSKNNLDTGFCFDDLGTESTLQHFGDKLNVLTEVLLNRYDDKVFPTHVTTNITVQQIKEAYGERLFDRMKAMFNQITFPVEAQSLRK